MSKSSNKQPTCASCGQQFTWEESFRQVNTPGSDPYNKPGSACWRPRTFCPHCGAMVTEWHITRQQDFDEWIWVGENVSVNQDVPLPPSPIYGSGVSIPLQFTVYYDESSIDIPQIKAYLARPQTPQLSKGIQLWKEAYDQSFTKYQNGDMNESLRLFKKAVGQGLPNSDQAVIHGAYADHFFLHNDIDSAYEHCLRSIELDPSKFWKVHFYLSLIYEALDEKDEAKKAYRNARRFAQTQWFTDEGELDARRAIQNWIPHPLPKPGKPDIFTGSESKEVKSPIGEKSPKTHEEKIRNKSTETTKKCPLCAEQIPLASVTCEYCGTQFTVTSTGYCQTCHDVRDADGNGQCKVCGNAVIDLRMESKIVEEPIQKPLPISPPLAETEITKTERSRLPIGILAGVLIFAVIGAVLWFGRNSIPAVSSLFPTITPTATTTFTPTSTSTTTPTSTPTRTPRPTPTATPPPAWVTNFAEPILGAIKNREPDFQDDFSFDTKMWYQLWEPGTLVIEEGVMRIMQKKGGGSNIGASNYYFLKKPNIVLQVDITRPTTCCQWVDVSRRPHNGIYLGADLEWGVYGGEKWVKQGNYSFRSQIQVMIIVRGSQIGYYLNGIPVAYYEDLALLNDGKNERSFHCNTFCEFDNAKAWNLDNIPNLP